MDNKLRAAVLDALARGDAEEARRLLAEVHREKTYVLGDHYLGRDAAGEAARLHALHIALLSLLYGRVEAGGITGADLALASAFAKARADCGPVEPPQAPEGLADLYRLVAEELARLARELCSRS
ncbi:MAG: hypothetical protein ACP5KY_09545 [Thermoproteus sp.]